MALQIAIDTVCTANGYGDITAIITADHPGAIDYITCSSPTYFALLEGASPFTFTNLPNGTYYIQVVGGGVYSSVVEAVVNCEGGPPPQELTLVSMVPARDWLPVGQPITYTFQSPNAVPDLLALRIEVSSNGIDFDTPLTAGVLVLPPDSNKRYTVNIAPYLESMFEPGPPVLMGADYSLYKKYRVLAGELPTFDGYTGTPELTSPEAHCLYATQLTTPDVGFLSLTKPPYGVNSSLFSWVETSVNLATSQLTTRLIAYDTENPAPQMCYKYPVQLFWLNRAGGWQTWVWDGKHEYGQNIPEPVTWKDENDRTHRAGFPEGIAETVTLYSGFIPASVYDVVFGVLSAIRVYQYQNGLFREVNIEPGEYPRHKEGQRRKELNFSLTYADTLTVQNA